VIPVSCLQVLFVNIITYLGDSSKLLTELTKDWLFLWLYIKLKLLVVIGTDCIDSCKSNYHTITTTTTPFSHIKIISFFAVEFPAVLLNTLTGEIESEFQFYVQPQEQPVLSEFCQQLTGLTQVSD
jgi:hypothetical protein